MAQSLASTGTSVPDTSPEPDYRFSGFGYRNWDMDGAPPIIVNPAASLHHKLAWLWGEVSVLRDVVDEVNTCESAQLRAFANFIASRLMPMEAMLDHLGEITSKGVNHV